MDNVTLPQELISMVDSERKDFVVRAKRIWPLKKIYPIFFFGVFELAFSSVFVFIFFGPLFRGEEVHFEENGVPVVAGPDNLEPIVIPAIVLGIFVLTGIIILSVGVYLLMFKKGGYFVGTPARLICYQNGNIRSIDWEQFSGDIEVKRNKDQKGDISLKMRTGKMISREDESPQYVPDVIYITGVPNVFEIEEICRRRIKENDPTPSIRDKKI